MSNDVNVEMVNSNHLGNDRNCFNMDNYIIGHDLTASEMVRCSAAMKNSLSRLELSPSRRAITGVSDSSSCGIPAEWHGVLNDKIESQSSKRK